MKNLKYLSKNLCGKAFKKRNDLTFDDKIYVIEQVNGGTSYSLLAEKLSVSLTQIFSVVKRKNEIWRDFLLFGRGNRRRRIKHTKNDVINDKLTVWLLKKLGKFNRKTSKFDINDKKSQSARSIADSNFTIDHLIASKIDTSPSEEPCLRLLKDNKNHNYLSDHDDYMNLKHKILKDSTFHRFKDIDSSSDSICKPLTKGSLNSRNIQFEDFQFYKTLLIGVTEDFFEKLTEEDKFPISGQLFQRKALKIAKAVGHLNFRASNGWLECFKRRFLGLLQQLKVNIFNENIHFDRNKAHTLNESDRIKIRTNKRLCFNSLSKHNGNVHNFNKNVVKTTNNLYKMSSIDYQFIDQLDYIKDEIKGCRDSVESSKYLDDAFDSKIIDKRDSFISGCRFSRDSPLNSWSSDTSSSVYPNIPRNPLEMVNELKIFAYQIKDELLFSLLNRIQEKFLDYHLSARELYFKKINNL